MIRRILATGLAATFVLGVSPSLFAQQGAIAGRANREARQPYTDYNVQAVDVSTRQVAATVPLDDRAQFSFTGLPNDKQYLVQLFNVRENRIVCTEGPFALFTPTLSRMDVNIACGQPAALWLLAAGAGVATTIAVVTQSSSQ